MASIFYWKGFSVVTNSRGPQWPFAARGMLWLSPLSMQRLLYEVLMGVAQAHDNQMARLFGASRRSHTSDGMKGGCTIPVSATCCAGAGQRSPLAATWPAPAEASSERCRFVRGLGVGGRRRSSERTGLGAYLGVSDESVTSHASNRGPGSAPREAQALNPPA